MTERNFSELLAAQCAARRYVCIGLDSRYSELPQHLRDKSSGSARTHPQFVFNAQIVDATQHVAGAYKPNLHFYLSQGPAGYQALIDTVRYINRMAPDVPVILDYKTGDIGNTNEEIAQVAYDVVGADAATYHNYTGREAMAPILNRGNKGAIILCKTSNPGSGEFQDLYVATPEGERVSTRHRQWEWVAENVRHLWDTHGNCGLVVGATYLDELREVRAIVDDMPLLLPGAGAQGGDAGQTVRVGIPSPRHLATVNSSRGIIFAGNGERFSDGVRQAAERMHDEIVQSLAA